MKRFLLLPVLLLSGLLFAQPAVKVFHERLPDGGGFVLYGNNEEWYPVSVFLDLKLDNLAFSEGGKTQFLLPPRSEKLRIGDVKPEKAGTAFKFSFRYNTATGDVDAVHDDSYVYDLPFATGGSFLLFQGYNGNFSHRGESALDFTMPEGTEIRAAREGTVVKVVQQHTQACASESCKQYNNYVTIRHPDGTFGHYAHIAPNGALVKLGDSVRRGDPIARSGNTGWTSGPHLHFVVYRGDFGKWKTLPTRFRVSAGETGALKEGVTYTRTY
ncbi:M23 family metallopeptidase [Flaviaesturariibacter amylovorans]|uniref:M23ase beta-sheet core domain-containing protein n=1 Tax=Flaviaesturariibacter amylovorans TaxID=1084520 RepID=A0ABP8GXF8_9BACT